MELWVTLDSFTLKRRERCAPTTAPQVCHLFISPGELGLLDADPSYTRRNVITSGLALNSLVGQELEIQDIRFLSVEECRPCYWMNNAFPHAEAATWLNGHGGLRARIVTDGVLRCDGGNRV